MNSRLLVTVICCISLVCTLSAAKRPLSFNPIYTSVYRVDPVYPNQLVNAEGKHLFLLNRTAWTYFTCSYPENVIKKAKEQGATIIRVAMEGTPYKNVLNYDLWPWGGTREKPDYTRINEPYWAEVENRIRLAGENGIGIDFVLYFTLKPTKEDIQVQQFYWKTILKRLAKYPNIICWEIMNEYIKNEEFQDAAGDYFYKNDPYKRPVISSDGTTDDALWPEKRWMRMAIVHTCTGSVPEYDLQNWYNAVARNTRSHCKPAFNNESGREKRHKNDDGVHRRKQAWLANSAGCFWTHHTLDGCEGINDTTYVSPGQEFLKPLSDFFQSIPFWKLQPNYSVCQLSTDSLIINTMTDAQRSIGISYICTATKSKEIKGLETKFRLPNGTFRVEFINPATNQKIGEQIIKSINLRYQYPILLPDFTDDIVLKFTKIKIESKAIIPGTE